MRYLTRTKVLHVVFDRYLESSIKFCCRRTHAKGFTPVYKLTLISPLPKQAVLLNVSANKQQIIELIKNQMSSQPIPEGKQVILTGQNPCPIEVKVWTQQPTITQEEADVLVAHYMIKEATRGHSLIKVVSDDTDVLVLLAHHLCFRTNYISNSVHVIMEASIRNHSVMDVNKVIKKDRGIMLISMPHML